MTALGEENTGAQRSCHCDAQGSFPESVNHMTHSRDERIHILLPTSRFRHRHSPVFHFRWAQTQLLIGALIVRSGGGPVKNHRPPNNMGCRATRAPYDTGGCDHRQRPITPLQGWPVAREMTKGARGPHRKLNASWYRKMGDGIRASGSAPADGAERDGLPATAGLDLKTRLAVYSLSLWRCSSEAEQGSHKPCVGGSSPPTATTYR